MFTGLIIVKNDGKMFLPEINFKDIPASSSTTNTFKISYMFGNTDDYFAVISSSAQILTYDKATSGSSNLDGQECVDEGWISLDVGDGEQQMISGSILNIGSMSEGEMISSNITLTLPPTVTTAQNFWCYMRIKYLAERTGIFSRIFPSSTRAKYGVVKYGSGSKY